MLEKDSKFYYNKGTLYNDEGKYGLAIDNFNNALSIDPNLLEARFNLGVAYLNKKEFDSAIECFQIVLQKSPNEVAALSNMALAYVKKQEFTKAIDYYKKVLSINPDDIDTFKDLGDAYTKSKHYDEAIECYQKVLKTKPYLNIVKASLNTAINLKNYANLSKTNDEPDKREENETVFHKPIETPKTYFESAINYVKEQEFDLAIENLRKCLKGNPDYPNACDLLNKVFKIKEKLDIDKQKKQNIQSTKIPTLEENISKKEAAPKIPVFIDQRQFNEFYTLGLAYYNAKNHNMALDYFKKCAEIDPDDENCSKYILEINSLIK